MVTEAGELWACGWGAQGRLGLNDRQERLVPTRVDPQDFAHTPISAVAAGDFHSAAVTAGGAAAAGRRARGAVGSPWRGTVKDMCYEIRRAEASVD